MKFLVLITLLSVISIFTNGQQLNDGSVVKSLESDEIYLIINKRLHLIPDAEVFNNLFMSFTSVKPVSSISLEVLPEGAPLKKGSLIKASSFAVYLQYDKYKIHIPNPETFNAFSFDWGKIINVSDDELSKYITLPPMSSVTEVKKWIEPKPCGTRD